MLYLYLNLLNLIILFGSLDSQITLIASISGKELMMVLILVGLMAKSLLMLRHHVLKQHGKMNGILLNGLLNDMRLVYYWDHLQTILVLLMMFIIPLYLLYQNLILKSALLLIYRIHDGVLVLMIVLVRMQRRFNISCFVKYVNSFMI